MAITEFSLGHSWIHRLDPRVKISAAVVFSMVVALGQSVSGSAVALIFPLAIVVAARVSLTKVLARLAFVNGFVLFLWCVLPLTVLGEAVYSFGAIGISREGVHQAFLITLKANAILLTMIAMLGTSPVFSLVHALSHMGVPDKLVHLFFLSFRYVHLIHEEYHRLSRAMKVRGFRPRTSLHTYRTYAYLLGMLLVRSFDRSKRILAAMKCRGFRGNFHTVQDYAIQKGDYVLAAAGLLCSLAVVAV
jgi:cobalt/nickel transport system permease protein